MANEANPNQNDEETIVREYECGYLVLPTIPSEKVSNEEEQVKRSIREQGGEIANAQESTHFPLAYTMSLSKEGTRERYTEGYFGWVTFEATTQQVNDIKEALRQNQSLLRFMVVKADKDQEPVVTEDESEGAASDESDEESTEAVSEEELDKSIDGLVEEGASKEATEGATETTS